MKVSHPSSIISTCCEKRKGLPLAMLPVPTAWIAEALLKKQLLNPSCLQGNLLKQIKPKPNVYEITGLHPRRAGWPMGHGRCLLSSLAPMERPQDRLCLCRGKTHISHSHMSQSSCSQIKAQLREKTRLTDFCVLHSFASPVRSPDLHLLMTD